MDWVKEVRRHSEGMISVYIESKIGEEIPEVDTIYQEIKQKFEERRLTIDQESRKFDMDPYEKFIGRLDFVRSPAKD